MCVIPNPQKISLKITDPLDISPILRYLATHEDPDGSIQGLFGEFVIESVRER